MYFFLSRYLLLVRLGEGTIPQVRISIARLSKAALIADIGFQNGSVGQTFIE